MDFFSYSLVNSAISVIMRPLSNWLGSKVDGKKKLQETLDLKDYQHELDLETLRISRISDIRQKQQLQKESFNHRLQEAQQQHKLNVQRWQDTTFDQRIWPLKTPYENFSLKPLP
ncbi:MAG TPA: hypothetical protein VHT34_11170, partial [Clostridia bacterium]|nr:hypothetical protein [Clostridia bacterium]